MYYTILWNMPGYLPEMEPYIVKDYQSAISALYDEVDRMADEYYDSLSEDATRNEKDVNAEWADILESLENDKTTKDQTMIIYHLPNGYVIEAIYTLPADISPEELAELES